MTHPNMHPAAGEYTNALELAAEFEGTAAMAGVRSAAVVRHYAMLLETRIKANASGRPGPNVITGDYRRSWNTVFITGGDTATATVGTNKPQGRRLEYGFVGPDRIGRVFNQAPFPHVGPALDKTIPEFEIGMAEVLRLDGGSDA